ncbi:MULTISPECIES: hypothetical protein [Microbacterium]|jgi:hypothetical protein|uniref:Uncharacterized protein n=1 Tax=Microbacterium ginsengisoli TaxID=400772 RepID=A0A0F0LU49_9MICO|nr:MULTISPECIES: hypothetical protein [Microbacterium]KJL36792.1 hypothetical protein RR49_01344 [Microbacterium ginsengisoli]MBN9198181.1 hypothetical protein [Microbacterium ginsengisoli]MBN9208342.1 hypothetical protein [Microbacterium ginsengisoli]MCK9915396.1 hypothetical protein [Microbacteriaceae bacterium K1510]
MDALAQFGQGLALTLAAFIDAVLTNPGPWVAALTTLGSLATFLFVARTARRH